MLVISNLCKNYGPRTLFEEASLQINRGELLGLVGPNGAGKSTLFQIILGGESSDSGEVVFERGCRVGHLPQESLPVHDETVLELATSHRMDFHQAPTDPMEVRFVYDERQCPFPRRTLAKSRLEFAQESNLGLRRVAREAEAGGQIFVELGARQSRIRHLNDARMRGASTHRLQRRAHERRLAGPGLADQ